MLQAIFFDFNGVIVDDEPIHFKAFQRVLQEEGISLNREEYDHVYIGMDDKGTFKHVLERYMKPADPKSIQKFIQKKAILYNDMMSKEIRFFPGVKPFIEKVAAKQDLAIVSGALRKEIDTILLAGKLKHSFKVIIAAEDVQDGKPSPEGYRLALTRLNERLSIEGKKTLSPEDCLVIEDTLAGIEAGTRAGIKCLALAHSLKKEKLYEMADFIAGSFQDINMKEIEETYW